MWAVSQWAGDFNPAHMHDGDLSGVFYTKMPKSIEKERAAEDHYPSVGDIIFMCGDPKTFSGHKLQTSTRGRRYIYVSIMVNSHGLSF